MKRLMFISLLFLCACGVTKEEIANVEEMEGDMPLQEAFDVTYLYSDSAVIQARLEAPHVVEKKVNDEPVSFFDDGFELFFFGPTGEVESNLTANEGSMNMKKGVASAIGNVVIVNNDKERIESEALYWNKEQDLIYSDKFVKIHTKEQIVYGDSLEANADFSEYKIFQIRGIINLDEEE